MSNFAWEPKDLFLKILSKEEFQKDIRTNRGLFIPLSKNTHKTSSSSLKKILMHQ